MQSHRYFRRIKTTIWRYYLVVGDRLGGVFFSEFEGSWSDLTKLFDPKKRRMVLVSRYYDWPSVSAPAIAKAAASIATTVKVAASTLSGTLA